MLLVPDLNMCPKMTSSPRETLLPHLGVEDTEEGASLLSDLNLDPCLMVGATSACAGESKHVD